MCLLVFIFGLGFGAKASAATFYVDSSVTDTHVASATPDFTNYNHTDFTTGSGSDSVFKTIGDINAFSALAAGDQVLFRKGQTWREQLTVPSSGSAGSLITFGAYGSGAQPVFNGADIVSSWTPNTGQVLQQASGASDDSNGGSLGMSTWVAANFVANATYTLTQVSVGLRIGAGTPFTSAVHAYIYSDSSGHPGSSLGEATATAQPTLTSSTVYYPWTFSGISLNSGTTYWVVLKTNAEDDLNWARQREKYVGSGSLQTMFSGNGTSWTQADLAQGTFNVYVTQGVANVWQSSVAVQPHAVYFNGVIGVLKTSIGTLAQAGDWYWAGGTLFVYSTSNPSTAYTLPGVEVVQRMGINANSKNYLTVDGLTMTKFYPDGILMSGSSTTVQNCTFDTWEADNAVALAGGGNGIMIMGSNEAIKNNTFSHGVWGISSYTDSVGIDNILIQSNTVHDMQGNGINPSASSATYPYTNIVTEHNTVYNCALRAAIGPSYGIVYGSYSSGSGNIIRNNISYNNGNSGSEGIGFGVEGAGVGGVKMYSNIGYGNFGSCVMLMGGANHVFENNSCYNDVNGSFGNAELFLTSGASNATVENNIFYATNSQYILKASAGATTGHTINYNLYFGGYAGTPFVWSGTAYNFANYKNSSSQDANSLNSDPIFTSTSDFHLQSTSPAINAGTNVGLTSDYANNPVPSGSGYDIGAYEYQADTTPNAFVFTDITNASLSTQYTSNTITVAGIDDQAAITITGGTYSINGGAYISNAGTVANGNTVTVRVTSSALYSTAVDAALTIGGVSDTYTVATLDDTVPDAFTLNDITDATLSTQYTSNQITVAGINAATAITITGGTYSKNSGAYTSDPGTVVVGDTVTVRVTSSGSFATAVNAVLTIGGVSDTYTVTTLAEDTTPTAFTFTDINDADLSTVYTSNTITVAGINSPADITITGGTYSKNGGAYTANAGTVINGDTVTMRVTSSASYSTPVDAVLTIGGVSDTYTVTTLDDTTNPNTTIDSHPDSSTTSTSATFEFSSDDENASFKCKLDDADYAICTSPQDFTGLALGNHTFSAKAIDEANNEDPSPATFSWTITETAVPANDNQEDNYDKLDISKVKYSIINNNQIKITFKTNNNSKGTARYGIDKNLEQKEKESKNKKQHTINLKNLALGTKYYFRISAEDTHDQSERSKIYSITLPEKVAYTPTANKTTPKSQAIIKTPINQNINDQNPIPQNSNQYQTDRNTDNNNDIPSSNNTPAPQPQLQKKTFKWYNPFTWF